MKKRYYYLFIGIALIFILLQGSLMPQQKKRRKSRPCKNCFSVNFNDVEMHDWLKTMASLIRKNILVDDSVKGKITVISYQKIPESRALAFMKQVLEIKGYGVIEEPNLLKIVNLKKAGEASLPGDDEVNFLFTESSTSIFFRIRLAIVLSQSCISTSLKLTLKQFLQGRDFLRFFC